MGKKLSTVDSIEKQTENNNVMAREDFKIPVPEKKLKSRFFKSAVILMTVFLLVGGGVYVWSEWLSPGAIEAWKYGLYQKYYVDRYENAMRQDVWGGKTPQETLDLLVAALKQGDIDLASKYFALNTDENSEYYLTRKQWEEGLEKNRQERIINQMIATISQMEISSRQTGSTSSVEYIVKGGDGVVDYSMIFNFNDYSGVWKIESM